MTDITENINVAELDKVREYSAVCKQLYKDTEKGIQILGWTVYNTKKGMTGFYGAVLKKDDNYLIVYRGTNDIMDWVSNTLIGLTIRSRQFKLADELYKNLIADCPEKEKITIAGHSLGGGLAEYIGATYGIRTYTFNGIGIKHYLSNKIIKNNDFSNITNFMSVVDLVGNLLPHTTLKSYYVKQPQPILNNEESLDKIRKRINILRKIATTIVDASSYFPRKISSIYNSVSNWLYKKSMNVVAQVLEAAQFYKSWVELKSSSVELDIKEKEDAKWYKVAHGLEFFIEVNEKDIEYLEKNNYL